MPFNIKLRNSDRNFPAPISWIEYIELNALANQYRLERDKVFSKNGNVKFIPFDDGIVQVFEQGTKMTLTTSFGVTMTFDGNYLMEVMLCTEYLGYVCGLCGNADGNATAANEFVDRFNVPVDINETDPFLFKWFDWGSNWKINHVDSDLMLLNTTDLDGFL